MEEILVSVSCLAYNHENYIQKCLDGFLMQKTNFAFEILIHDDASTDKTVSIIKDYEKKYPKMIFPIYQKENQFSKRKGSLSVTFNYPRAKGKYIAMCEGDDYWSDPLKLQRQVDFLENNEDYNVCVHNTNILKNEKISKKEWRVHSKRTTFTVIDYIYSLFFHTSSIMFRSKEILKINFNPKILQGDMTLFLSLINNKKVYFIEKSMSVYRLHEGGITNDVFYKSKVNTYKSLLLVLDEFDCYSKGRFKKTIWLKKQTIRALIFLFNKERNKLVSLCLKAYYYIFKIILFCVVKLKSK